MSIYRLLFRDRFSFVESVILSVGVSAASAGRGTETFVIFLFFVIAVLIGRDART
jgi:hypothetical protein